MGGSASSVVSAALDPVGTVASAVTGQDIKLSPYTIGKNELYDKPKQALKDAEDEANRQQDEYNRSLKAFEDNATEDNKKARDLALQNLQRAQARLRGFRQSSNKGGTLLTSPLGVANDVISNTKTLLGF